MPGDGRRDLKKEKFWRRNVRAQANSRLSVRAWCSRQGLRESAFHWWRRELAQREAEARDVGVREEATESAAHRSGASGGPRYVVGREVCEPLESSIERGDHATYTANNLK